MKTATEFTFSRDKNGTPHVQAETLAGMYRGQGYAHAMDRGLQILLMRIIGQGRVSQYLDASDESLAIDIFFRRMNWCGKMTGALANLNAESSALVAAYCEGVNQYFAERIPWELKLTAYQHSPWTPEDVVLVSRMVGYLTLAQSQAEIERLLIEMVQAGIDEKKLEALFPGQLGEMDVALLKALKLEDRIVANHVLWGLAAPRAMASNNWVVSGSKTASGRPILANDPHLEVNRLPNVWCELVLECGERWMMGGSMPGLPGILVGRNPDLAWGATYSFADTIDSWVERCRDGKYYREEADEWLDFATREELILRKKKSSLSRVYYENELGTLEGDPFVDDHCLVTRWAAADLGCDSLQAVLDMWHAKSVKSGMATYGQIETGWNYVFADTDGNIGFQMSGKVPKRRPGISGLVPLPGWKKENHWQGFHALEDMPSSFNPTQGFFCTANNDLNQWGAAKPINIPMGSYRADRISEILEAGESLTLADMQQMHFDVYSRQAALFMAIILPLLPDTDNGRILHAWDFKYDAESRAAFLFESVYRALYREVFGRGGLGEDVVDFLLQEAGIFIDFYASFDRVLLSPASPWFAGHNREEVFQRAIDSGLAVEPKPWSSVQQFTMKHLMFGGKLPRFLGFDRGPITAIGGRATIHQGQIYRAGGRDTTFLPSFRWLTDLSEPTLHSNLAGGPSDRRFSKWYCSDLQNWLSGNYKRTGPTGS